MISASGLPALPPPAAASSEVTRTPAGHLILRTVATLCASRRPGPPRRRVLTSPTVAPPRPLLAAACRPLCEARRPCTARYRALTISPVTSPMLVALPRAGLCVRHAAHARLAVACRPLCEARRPCTARHHALSIPPVAPSAVRAAPLRYATLRGTSGRKDPGPHRHTRPTGGSLRLARCAPWRGPGLRCAPPRPPHAAGCARRSGAQARRRLRHPPNQPVTPPRHLLAAAR
jgi:hypothetical protein